MFSLSANKKQPPTNAMLDLELDLNHENFYFVIIVESKDGRKT